MTPPNTEPVRQPDVFGLTDPGLASDRNEDQFMVAQLSHTLTISQTSFGGEDHGILQSGPKGLLLVVADGVGGERGADQASRIAVETVTSYVTMTMPWFLAARTDQNDDAVEVLEIALDRANRTLRALGARHRSLAGMATTLTMAFVAWPVAYVVHAGSSRCYLYREKILRRLTRDHTVAAELAEKADLQLDEQSRFARVLSNAVGGASEHVRPDVVKGRLLAGDWLLLCTDGLTRDVEDKGIEGVLDAAPTAESATRSLVAGALAGKGSDNVTVISARF